MRVQWEAIETAIKEALSADLYLLEQRCDMEQTAFLRGRVGVWREVLRLPKETAEEEMSDRVMPPLDEEFIHGR